MWNRETEPNSHNGNPLPIHCKCSANPAEIHGTASPLGHDQFQYCANLVPLFVCCPYKNNTIELPNTTMYCSWHSNNNKLTPDLPPDSI